MVQHLLETADVGRVLGLTPAGVRALVRAGRLRPSVVTPRGARLFTREIIDRLYAERTAHATVVRAPENEDTP